MNQASLNAATAPVRLALFDLDHTLLPLDSDYEWGEFTRRLGWVDDEAFGRRNAEFFAQYQAGTLDVHAYVRFATEAVRLRGPEVARQAHEQFMDTVIRPAMRPAALELLERHQRAGDVCVIVTATNEFVTAPIAQAFGVKHLVAVELERDVQGWLTGEIAGIPSVREGKVQRVEQWLQARGWGWQDVHTTFYSDSPNDLPLLERVDVPVATNPSDRLRMTAEERGWQVLDLFSTAS